jgi:peptide deformylase
MKLPLCYYGNPVLRKKCTPVEQITDEIKTLIKDLEETMEAYAGLGISAPQVGKSLAIFLVRYPIEDESSHRYDRAPLKVYINPKLSQPSQETWVHEEGCLSIPKVYADVERPFTITITALDIDGKEFSEELSGWHARVVMHENDHINGVLFVDRISEKSRNRIEPALRTIKKKHGTTNAPHQDHTEEAKSKHTHVHHEHGHGCGCAH